MLRQFLQLRRSSRRVRAAYPPPRVEHLEQRGSPSALGLDLLSDSPLGNVFEVDDSVPVITRIVETRPDVNSLAGLATGMNSAAPPPPNGLFLLGIQPALEFNDEHCFRLDSGGARPPEIVDFSASEGEGGWWTFSGRVDAEKRGALKPGGLIVEFGGLPSLEGQTTEVDTNGTFSLTIRLRNAPRCEEGIATAQTSDWFGQPSNLAEDYVHQTSCLQRANAM